jgi:excisionase family DNA binding protein
VYTVKAVAEKLGVQIHAVLRWISKGEIAATNLARDAAGQRPRWRIAEQALAEFLERRTKQPPLPRSPRRKRLADVHEFY